MSEDANQPPKKPSKTQRKNDNLALQKLGEALIDLSASQLATIPLPPDLQEAIQLARSITAHGAMRRQLQYIGRLMREVDPIPIQNALKKIQTNSQQHTAQFHAVEQWRDQLLRTKDEGIQKLFELYPQADRQHLRQLLRKALQDEAQHTNTGGKTELFRYLRTLIV